MKDKKYNLQDPGEWDECPTEVEKQKSELDEIAYYKALERKEQYEQMKARNRYLNKLNRLPPKK